MCTLPIAMGFTTGPASMLPRGDSLRRIGRIVVVVVALLALIAADPGAEAGPPPVEPTEAALAEVERQHGFLHPSAMSLRATLIGLYRMVGRYGDAEAVLRREIATLEAAEGPSSPRLAAPLNRLAGVYREQERKAEADALLRRALAIYEAERDRQPAVRTPLRSAGEAAAPTPLPVAAPAPLPPPEPAPRPVSMPTREAPRRGLPPQVAAPRPVHAGMTETVPPPRVSPQAREGYLVRAATLDAEADTLWWRGDMRGVETRRRESLDLRMAALGADHPAVADSMVRLARFLLASSREIEGVDLFRRAIEIKLRGRPVDEASIAESRWELASLYLARGDYATAAPLMARALATWRRSGGLEPDRLDEREAAYAALLQQLGRANPATASSR